MKKTLLALLIATSFSAVAATQKPTDTLTSTHPTLGEMTATAAEAQVFKVVHHANYLKDQSVMNGGTNTLLHTRSLPTEGKDLVVTPALDHIYSKAVLDLSNGPVVMTFPKVADDHYFSLMVTDQEHYVTYDKVRPTGTYVFVRDDYQGEIPEADVVITDRGNHPHIFVRTQLKYETDAGYKAAHDIQDAVTLTGKATQIDFTDPLAWTLKTHDVYQQNIEFLAPLVGKYTAADQARMHQFMIAEFARLSASSTGLSSGGMFGPIDSPEAGSNDAFNRIVGIVGHLALPVQSSIDPSDIVTDHFAGSTNCAGSPFHGAQTEVITMPYERGLTEFWSITRYDGVTRNTMPGVNDIYNAYNTKPDAKGNITITFSLEDPKDGTYWMSVPNGPYYFAERNYGAAPNNRMQSWKAYNCK